MKSLSTIPRMKRMFVAVLLLTIGFTFSESVAQCVTPPSGMVSWWPGDGNTNDIQGGNHGTLINDATFAAGLVDQAFSFDGVGDYVSVPDNAAWDFGMNDFTIDLWVNFDQIKESMFIHQESGATFGGFEFDYQAHSSSLVFSWDGHGGFSRAWSPLINRWYHLAVTRTSGTYRMYVDGVQLGSDQFDSNPIANVTGNLRIGNWSGGAHYTVDGRIDEVDIYNRALSASEIQSIYNAGSAGKCANTPPPVCVNPPSGLVSWWPGENNANDIEDGNNGTLVNGATFTAGKVGQAFSLDGVDDFVEIPHSISLNPTNALSLEAWIYINQYTFIPAVVSKGNGGNYFESYSLTVTDDGRLQLVLNRDGTSDGRTNVLGPVIPLNTWTHVAGTYDGTTMRIYLNGAEVGNATHTGGIFITTHPVVIGKNDRDQNSFGYPTSFFNGLIDDVSIFNRALSAVEIADIYNAGSAGKCTNTPPPVCVNPPSGLVSWWPGESNANDIQDGNDGALQNGATFAAGKVEQALSLDGIDDFVLVPHNSNLEFGAGQDFTIDAWIKLANPIAGHDDEIVSKWDVQKFRNGTTLNFYRFFVNRDDYRVKLALGSNGVVYELLSNSSVQPGQWTHVVGLRKGSMGEIYVNGVLAASATLTAGSVANSDPLAIGGLYDTFFNPPVQQFHVFGGLIDEVEIFNRALSASEIQSIYNAGSAGKCKECTPPEVSISDDDPVCPHSIHTYTATTDATNPSFNWSVTGGTLNGSNAGSSVSVTAGDEGTMMVSVEVTDGATNCSNSATLDVSVEDTEPPVITTFPAHVSMWPPNHQYETILVAQCVNTVADNCVLLSPSDVVVDSVSSDEPEDAKGGGDGNTLNDIVIASDCKSVQLRSERQGGGNGRIYTLHLSVRDGNGNIGVATCFVIVPHSQNGNPAMDDGPAYFVFGNCSSAPKMAESFGQMSEPETLPEGYALEQNYPNPFNPSTSIAFSVKEAGVVQLTIYNLHGQEVRTLASGNYASGKYAITWDGKGERGQNAPSGVYLYKLRVNGFAQTRKMTFMK